MTTDNATESPAESWRRLCPELVKLEKSLGLVDPIRKAPEPSDNYDARLNRWGHPDAHTLKWMEHDARARIHVDGQFARRPTEDLNRPDPTTLAVQKQEQDEDFVLDQGFSTGQTDRLLREQGRKVIAKAHNEAGISVGSEYLRRDAVGDVNGPLDMGVLAISDVEE